MGTREDLNATVGTTLPSGTSTLFAADVRSAFSSVIDKMVLQEEVARPMIEVTASRAITVADVGAVLWTQAAGIELTIAPDIVPPGKDIELRTRAGASMLVVEGLGVSIWTPATAGLQLGELETRLLFHYSGNAFDLLGGAAGTGLANREPVAGTGAIIYDVEVNP